MISLQSVFATNGRRCCQTLASSRWKMPRPANRLRSIPPIAGRAGALANWSTNTKPISRARSGGIHRRDRAPDRKGLFASAPLVLQTTRTPFIYSVSDDVDFVHVHFGGGRISRYCPTCRLFANTAVADFRRDVFCPGNHRVGCLVDRAKT